MKPVALASIVLMLSLLGHSLAGKVKHSSLERRLLLDGGNLPIQTQPRKLSIFSDDDLTKSISKAQRKVHDLKAELELTKSFLKRGYHKAGGATKETAKAWRKD